MLLLSPKTDGSRLQWLEWRGSRLVLAILAASLLYRLIISWTDMPTLIASNLTDDSFIYFTVARNIVNGYGMTFDGQSLGNGFHPLWMLLLLPMFALSGGNGALPIHLALTFASVFDILTAWIVFITIRWLTSSDRAGLLGTAFYVFNLGAFNDSLNGLESSLSTLLMAISIYLFWQIRKGHGGNLPDRQYVIWGLTLGLSMLARTDNVIPASVLLAWMFIYSKAKRVRVLFAGSVAGIIVLPWLLFNIFYFGTIMQSSAGAFPYVLHEAYSAQYGSSPLLQAQRSLALAYNWTFGIIPLTFLLMPKSWPSLYFLVLGLIIGAFVSARTQHTVLWWSRVRLLAAPVLAIVALFLVHTLIRWYPRTWYFTSLVFVVAVALGLTSAYVFDSMPRRWSGRLAWAVFLILIGWFMWRIHADGPRYPWQIEMYRAGRWVAENVEPYERAASFNGGLIGYLGNGAVIDVAGVIDNEAYRALRQRKLGRYMRDRNIRYIIDFPHIVRLYKPFWGDDGSIELSLVKVINDSPVAFEGSHVAIFKIDWLREY